MTKKCHQRTHNDPSKKGKHHTGIPWTPWTRTAPKFSPVFETDVGEQDVFAAKELPGDGVHPPPCPGTNLLK